LLEISSSPGFPGNLSPVDVYTDSGRDARAHAALAWPGLEVSLAAFMIHKLPRVFQMAQPRPEAQTIKGQELYTPEKAQFIQERRMWRAVIDAEWQRLEVFLRTCTFD